jgi:SAM-dependent methyltransferase
MAMDTALYTDHIAQHYAAYRPPLHQVILERILGDTHYPRGLDIGCGTGQSSLALLPFCKEIIAIDPSKDMLAKAIANKAIEYGYFDKVHLDFKDQYFDIITLAGSLFYGKSQQLLDEISRVLQPGGRVIVYDFNILLTSLQALFPLPDITGYYDHTVNFDGLALSNLQEVDVQKATYSLALSTAELAHLLLADEPTYENLQEFFTTENLFDSVLALLGQEYGKQQQIDLPATLYWSVYKN